MPKGGLHWVAQRMARRIVFDILACCEHKSSSQDAYAHGEDLGMGLLDFPVFGFVGHYDQG